MNNVITDGPTGAVNITAASVVSGSSLAKALIMITPGLGSLHVSFNH
jgi:hypothetical protein